MTFTVAYENIELWISFVVSYHLFVFFNYGNVSVGFWKSRVIQKSCQVNESNTCDFQNPILTFPTHSIFTLLSLKQSFSFESVIKASQSQINNCLSFQPIWKKYLSFVICGVSFYFILTISHDCKYLRGSVANNYPWCLRPYKKIINPLYENN